jgi:hypothetical protein
VEVNPVEEGGASGSGGGELTLKDYGCEQGERKPIKIMDPKLPTQEEVDDHFLDHLPYRSWCAHCVRGKGKTMDHRICVRDSVQREIHIDYCFMGKATDDNTKTIVVAKERDSKMIMSSVVPVKGMTNVFAAKRIGAFIRELGLEHHDVALKGDQEPALQDLLREVGRQRVPAKTFYDQSAVGSSASNGVIERGVQTVEGQIRVMRTR